MCMVNNTECCSTHRKSWLKFGIMLRWLTSKVFRKLEVAITTPFPRVNNTIIRSDYGVLIMISAREDFV